MWWEKGVDNIRNVLEVSLSAQTSFKSFKRQKIGDNTCRRIKSSQNVQPQMDLPNTELPFFLFESLLSLFTNAEFTNTHGAVTGEKMTVYLGKKFPFSEVCIAWLWTGLQNLTFSRI